MVQDETEEEQDQNLTDEEHELVEEEQHVREERARILGDYGLDSPRVVGALGVTIAASLAVTVIAGIVDEVPVMAVGFVVALVVSMVGLVVVRASRVHKLRERVRFVNHLRLDGDELVLDVGCGRGLLLTEVANRLDGPGRAIGVDLWRTSAADARGFVNPENTGWLVENVALEGVDDRVDVTSADVRSLPFPDGVFDAVVSGLALHHIEGFEWRLQAVREIARVLRPHGRVVLIDRHHTRTYVDALRSCNFVDVLRSRRIWRLIPPARYVVGTKAEVVTRKHDVAVHEALEELAEQVVAEQEVADDLVEAEAEELEAAEELGGAEELLGEAGPGAEPSDDAPDDDAPADEQLDFQALDPDLDLDVEPGSEPDLELPDMPEIQDLGEPSASK